MNLPLRITTLATIAACGAAIVGCRPTASPTPDAPAADSTPLKPAAEPIPDAAPAAEADSSATETATAAGTAAGTGTATEAGAELPPIPWLRDHDQAFAQAKKLGKPVLINFWCGT
jgi:hypothetical protein